MSKTQRSYQLLVPVKGEAWVSIEAASLAEAKRKLRTIVLEEWDEYDIWLGRTVKAYTSEPVREET